LSSHASSSAHGRDQRKIELVVERIGYRQEISLIVSFLKPDVLELQEARKMEIQILHPA
jgi:hypothetical protein